MITFKVTGSTKRTSDFLQKMQRMDLYSELDGIGRRGVEALRANTPVDTGLTAASWGYEITRDPAKTTITWYNTHNESGANIAILLQYGHGTGTGGFVSGQDYINPAIQPIFDEIAESVWRRVTSA